MLTASNHDALIAQGVKFRVLARAFPVLRHDALKPIANAKLATAMMQRAAGEVPSYSEERTQQLLSDIDYMLDEGVDSVRLLGDWLTETDKQEDSYRLLKDCVKLLFSDLLLSGKKVTLLDSDASTTLPLHSSRYVIFGWLLHLIELAPDGSELELRFLGTQHISARLRPGQGGTILRPSATNAKPSMPYESVEALATHYGWTVGQVEGSWKLGLPKSDGQSAAITHAA